MNTPAKRRRTKADRLREYDPKQFRLPVLPVIDGVSSEGYDLLCTMRDVFTRAQQEGMNYYTTGNRAAARRAAVLLSDLRELILKFRKVVIPETRRPCEEAAIMERRLEKARAAKGSKKKGAA